jgi:hypothetical protein
MRAVGLRVHVRPTGDIVNVREMVPVKLFTGVSVIVEVAATPAKVLTLVGLAVTM